MWRRPFGSARQPAFTLDGSRDCLSGPARGRTTYALPVTIIAPGEVQRFERVEPLLAENVRFSRAFLRRAGGIDTERLFDATVDTALPSVDPADAQVTVFVEFSIVDPTRPAGAYGARVTYQDASGRHTAVVRHHGVMIAPPTWTNAQTTAMCSSAFSTPDDGTLQFG